MNAVEALAFLESNFAPVDEWDDDTRTAVNAIRAALGVDEIQTNHRQAVRDFAATIERMSEYFPRANSVSIEFTSYDNSIRLQLLAASTLDDAALLAGRLGLTSRKPRDVSGRRHHNWDGGSFDGCAVTLVWIDRNPPAAASDAPTDYLADDFDALGGVAGLRADLGLTDDEDSGDYAPHRFTSHHQADGAWCPWSHVGVAAGPLDRHCPGDCESSSVELVSA